MTGKCPNIWFKTCYPVALLLQTLKCCHICYVQKHTMITFNSSHWAFKRSACGLCVTTPSPPPTLWGHLTHLAGPLPDVTICSWRFPQNPQSCLPFLLPMSLEICFLLTLEGGLLPASMWVCFFMNRCVWFTYAVQDCRLLIEWTFMSPMTSKVQIKS